MLAVGSGLTVTTVEVLAVQELASVTVTVYVPLVETVIDAVVGPEDQT
jgi:hypothetical protein